MNNKTGGNRCGRRAGAVAVMAAVALLTAGCGFVHVHFGSSSAPGSVTFQPNAAFVHCVRRHGLTEFPNASGNSITMQLHGNIHALRAYDACKHLL
jgi:hypothetical protein